MAEKDKSSTFDKKRQRVSSSGSHVETTEDSNNSQDGAFITLTVAEYQSLITKITHIEDKAKASDTRILKLEARLDEAQKENQSLKQKLTKACTSFEESKESLEFTQGERSDMAERVTLCETEQSAQWNKLTQQNIYNRRWNLIFYRIIESPEEDCSELVKNVLTEYLQVPEQNVRSMKFCGAHRLGKKNGSKTRPIIVRFTCRTDRDLVWGKRFLLKDTPIAMGGHFPKHIQDLRKNMLIPALQQIKKQTPRAKALVIGNRLIVNGKQHFH